MATETEAELTEALEAVKSTPAPKPKKQSEMILTQSQFDDAVEKAARKVAEQIINERMAQYQAAHPPQVITFQPHADVVEEEGVTVPPTYVPKDKSFRVHKMNDGSLELKKRSLKKNFNALERDAVILAIDEKFKILTREVAGQEKPKPPTKLFVTGGFRELFEHQNRWSDASDIMVVSDLDAQAEDYVSIKGSSVRFKFAK